MGLQDVSLSSSSEQIRLFEKSLLNDIRALERMLEQGMFECGVRRIGAEQELFLIDKQYQPAPLALRILERLDDPTFTTELGSFNLEFNLPPLRFDGNCLKQLQDRLDHHISKVRSVAHALNADAILVGILPTLQKRHLSLDNMTPKDRYYALNEAMMRLRGKHYDLFLRGTDELYLRHDSVMLEACNASFQVHFQIGVDEFAKYYNIAQVLAAPVLAVAVNSPLLFGRRLWNETRIGVFQQSTDTRSGSRDIRQPMARVHFGRGWLQDSILEIFKEDIARFRVLFGSETGEDSVQMLKQGKVPALKALQLHNSTVYRWNRPCFGITNNKPHLRIENRVLPSGPTTIDEVANTAFWLGLIGALAAEYDDITTVMDFDDAKANFYASARRGIKAQFTWLKGETIPARELVTSELLPLARRGLQKANIDSLDSDLYLGIIQERVETGQTGAQWFLSSFTNLKSNISRDRCLSELTKASLKNQQTGRPVHKWRLASCKPGGNLARNFERVEQYMTTDLFTVGEDTTAELVLSVMKWRRIRHIPVEDNRNRLIGMITYRSLVRLIDKQLDKDLSSLPAGSIMQRNIPVVAPETPTLDAIALMKKHGVSSLPVIRDKKLVGIVTEHDLMNIAAYFLEASLKKEHTAKGHEKIGGGKQ